MPPKRLDWPVRTRSMLALCGALTVSACAAKYAQVPARLDLEPYGRIALVAFTAERTDSAMSALATRRFAEALLASQGVELLELDAAPADSTLERLHVPAMFVGELKLSDVRPHGGLSPAGMSVRGGVSAELSVRLLSRRTGGTVWRSSAAANGTVGRVTLTRGLPSVAVRDREAAYGELVQTLVAGVTRDLRPTWIRE